MRMKATKVIIVVIGTDAKYNQGLGKIENLNRHCSKPNASFVC